MKTLFNYSVLAFFYLFTFITCVVSSSTGFSESQFNKLKYQEKERTDILKSELYAFNTIDGNKKQTTSYSSKVSENRESRNNLDYVDSVSVEVHEVWIKNEVSEVFNIMPLEIPRVVQLIPSSDDMSNLLVDLSVDPGDYNEIRLFLNSGNVKLTEETRVFTGHVFSTDLGNLILPGVAQNGLRFNVAPSINVVTKLSKELTFDFDFSQSFVFNGSPTNGKGVKRVIFSPNSPAANVSTHGRISVKVLKTNSDVGICLEEYESVANAAIIATDLSGITQGTTTTDSNGNAWITLLPGSYNIEITNSGNEPIIIENQMVYIANDTDLGDVIFGRNAIADITFNEERAILLAVMTNTAYAKEGDGGWSTSINESNEGDPLPSPSLINTYANDLLTKWTHYNCWIFYKFIENQGDGTEIFIAYNENNGDIVVSFRGTSEPDDFLTDANVIKVPWYFRDYPNRPNSISLAVHNGFNNAYENIKQELQNTLDEVIEKHATNPSTSRIYFTGHSLGGGLAEIAALDLTDYLKYEKGYNRKNIMMYSYGGPRTITYNLLPYYDVIVPNSFAVAAKDDYVPHAFQIFGAAVPSRADYTHIDNMAVLSTSLVNTDPDAPFPKNERYTEIGKTRVEFGDDHRLCLLGSESNIICALGFTRNYHRCGFTFTKLGHDQLQYLKRLETIDHGPDKGIPSVNINLVQIGPRNNRDRLQLVWDNGVQGPCDWVGLFRTESGEILTSADNPVGLIDGLGVNWEYVKNQNGYPNQESKITTGLNPNLGTNQSDDFWVAYVDGFGNILNKKKYVRPARSSNRLSIYDKNIDASEEFKLVIYPTITESILNVETRGNAELFKNYMIYNLMGQKMDSGIMNNNQIDVNELTSGLYFLIFDVENKRITERFIKK